MALMVVMMCLSFTACNNKPKEEKKHPRIKTCSVCNGNGKVSGNMCGGCGGTGTVVGF